jgi:DNA-directed RNA polymerase subunit RPC12/RpoP
MGGFEWVYKCSACGAEFAEGEGVKEGDVCPKCPWYKRVSGRSIGRLVGFGIFLIVGAVSFVVRKMRGS